MAIEQPKSTDFLNAPDHSKSHRVFGIDSNAPDRTLTIDSSGNTVFSGAGTTNIGGNDYTQNLNVYGITTSTSYIIGANTLDTNEWAYLDGQDQSVYTTSDVTHDDMTLSGDLAVNGGDITATSDLTITPGGDLIFNPTGNDVIYYKSGTADVTTNEYNSRDIEMLGSAWMLNAAYGWGETQPAGDTGKSWESLASDSDGSHLMVGASVGRLYTSADSGANWTERQPAGNVDRNWERIASDSDGSNLIAGTYSTSTGRLYTSSDYGVNWTERRPYGDTNVRWGAIASDDDGTNLIAGFKYGRLYTSSDSGVNWTERQPAGDSSKSWSCAGSDSDGSNLIAGEHGFSGYGGRLYTSTDSGASWVERQPAGNVNKIWVFCVSDSDGSNLIAGVGGGRLYTSTDSGVNWVERQPAGDVDKNWNSCASDSTGTHLVAGESAGRLYTSTDSGVSWTEEQPLGDLDGYWRTVASDSDGSNLIVANHAGTGRVYISTLTDPAETTRKITTRLIPTGNLATPKYRLGFLNNDDSEFFTLDGLNRRVGIGVVDPDTKHEILHAGTQLKLSYDATNYITFTTENDGDLTLDSNKASYNLGFGDANLLTTGTLEAGAITGTNFISNIAIGTSPYACTSTTLNTNLNADLWDGYQFTDYLNQVVKSTSSPTFEGGLTANGRVLLNSTVSYSVLVDSSDNIWATVLNGGLYKSTDKGVTFTHKDGSQRGRMIFEASNGYLYWSPWAYGKLRRSTDGGENWADVGSFTAADSGAWGFCEDSLGYLYASIYTTNGAVQDIILRSTDNGANWSTVYDGAEEHIHDEACDPYTDYIYATADRGGTGGTNRVVRSVDNGANWTSIDTGTAYLAINFLSGVRLFGGDTYPGKIYKTTDDSTFTEVYDSGFNQACFSTVKVGSIIYFGQTVSTSGSTPQVVSTTDGDSWVVEWIGANTAAWNGPSDMSGADSDGNIYVMGEGTYSDNNFRFLPTSKVITREIRSNYGLLKLVGGGETGDENLVFDFRTTDNKAYLSSETGITSLEFKSIDLGLDGGNITSTGNLTLDPATSNVILDNAHLQIQGTYDLIFKGKGTIIHEDVPALYESYYTETFYNEANTGWRLYAENNPYLYYMDTGNNIFRLGPSDIYAYKSLKINGTEDLIFKGAGTITHENADAHYMETYGNVANTGWYWNGTRTLFNVGGTTIMEWGVWTSLVKANYLFVANAGVNVGAKADANVLDDASTGAASTTLYIGNQIIVVSNSSPTLNALALNSNLTINNASYGRFYSSDEAEWGQLQMGDQDFTISTGGTNDRHILLNPNNNIGINTASPTGRLHLPAGTATASTAPLKFTSGTNLTSPEAGAVEYDGSRFYITGASARRVISRGSDSIITPITVVNTTDETTVFTASLPADSICANEVYIIEAYGKGSTHDAADTLTIRAKINGTTLLSMASTPKQVTDVPMCLRLICTVRTVGATGTFSSHGCVRIEDTENYANTSSTVIDTTASNNLTITFQWDDANAGNTATIDQGFLKLNN